MHLSLVGAELREGLRLQCEYFVGWRRFVLGAMWGEMMVARRLCVVVVLAALVAVAGTGRVTAVEEEECESEYNYLAGCLTFLSGPDVVPNAVCCGGIGYLNANDPDCLCTIILELDDNHNVNATKAFALPLQCSVLVDPVKCPSLALPPGSSLPPSLAPGLHGVVPGDESVASRISASWMMVFAVAFTGALALTQR